ncbi:DUF2092 domain-containing protein [Pseudaminobacter sp. NGMCC 1.201702]|uniref:DUF2092 domain-containing protein n=1 Tax=Pseudaminobacter sp. NGMCC 1.201702 TaxID=3391825 RepID=UPI0039F08FF1
MSGSILKRLGTAGRRYMLPSALMAALAAYPAAAQQIDPAADKILVAMSDNLKTMSRLSADYDADHEIIDLKGQKIQYSASGSLALNRAKGLRITRRGPFDDAELIFDGKTISLYGKALNVYLQLESPGPSIEEATEEFRAATGLDAPGADLLASDPYAVLTEGVIEGTVVGSAFVGGIECDHLAFRTDVVDWQIWISKGENPLPIKYVITTKWVTGAPEYSLRLTNWKSNDVDSVQFTFAPPAGAREVEQVYADVIGELLLEVGE